jgi:arginine-tRNA-protein transferase
MLPTRREAHSGCCFGLDAEWCELCLHLVSLTPSPVSDLVAEKSSYDPDYEHWEFGKLSAMREIALALDGSYQYYYMGR